MLRSRMHRLRSHNDFGKESKNIRNRMLRELPGKTLSIRYKHHPIYWHVRVPDANQQARNAYAFGAEAHRGYDQSARVL